MPRIKTQLTLLALGLLMPGGASAQRDSEPREPGHDTPLTTAARQPHDTTPGRLGSVPGFDSEQAYLEASATHVAELLDRASRASDELAAATLQLAAANLMLAEPLDAPCSMSFLHTLGLPDQADGGDDVGEVLSKARELLNQVGQRIDKMMEPVANMDEATADSWAALKNNQTSLAAFLNALHAFLLPQEHENVARAMRRAASGLAPLLERTEPDIVAAAALWYATLRAGEKSKKSALSVLSPVLQGRPAAGVNFAFYARLLRCRLIADRSSPPTALALLLQLEDSLGDWFDDDASRNQAARSLLLLRAHLLQGWKERLSNDAPTEEQQFLAKRTQAIRADLLKNDAAFLRLGHAIPVLVPVPQ